MTVTIGRINGTPVVVRETLLAHASGTVINTGVSDARAALAAVDAIGPHYVPIGTYRIASNLTLSSNFEVHPLAVIKPDNGVTVTITAQPDAGHYKWIDTSAGGKVVFQPSSMTTIRPAWWGLVADYDLSVGGSNGTDNAVAFQAMAASITPPSVAHGYQIQFPSGAARFTAGAVFTGSGIFLEGVHREATQLIFDPPADGATLIKFQRASALEFFGGGIRQLRIGSTSTNDRQKTAIHLIDVSEFIIEDFAINRLSSDTDANAYPSPAVRRQTNPSVGLHVQGREFLRLNRFTSFADRPIWIDNNPNYPGAPGAPTSIDLRIDCDTFHFSDLYLGTQAETEAGIVFYGAAVSGTLLPSGTQYGLNLQNFVLDGSNSFVGPGLSAIRYIVTAGQSWHANRSVLISNVRHEGTATDAGTLIDIELDNATLQGLIIRNVQPALNNAVKLRGCYDVTIEEFSYSSPAANARNVFDFDGTCNYIRGKNVSVAVSANNLMSFGTLRKAYAFGDTTNYAIERDFMLVQSAQIAHPHVIGNDPDNGSACYEFENSSGQRFRLVAGIPGASNNGVTLRDMTNGANAWHYVNGVLVLDQTTSALRPFILAPPNVPVYGAAITINGTLSNTFDLTATNGTAFTIGAPLSPAAGQEITITIRNTSGGALGAVTWNAVYKLAAWTSPATGFSRSIVFFYDGTNWVEKSRTPADVPN